MAYSKLERSRGHLKDIFPPSLPSKKREKDANLQKGRLSHPRFKLDTSLTNITLILR
jgi:hypothetical protein